MKTNNVQCIRPDLSPITAYHKGCRCLKCKQATSLRKKEYAKKHPEQIKLSYLKSKAKRQQWFKSQQTSDPNFIRKRMLRTKYSMTLSDYKQLLEQQSGVCAICFKENKLKVNLVVDHDHITGKVRGLLCNSCNLALGWFEDDYIRIKQSLVYLEQHE